MNIFDDIFDFNRDGKIDSFEKTAEFCIIMDMIEKEKKKKSEKDKADNNE